MSKVLQKISDEIHLLQSSKLIFCRLDCGDDMPPSYSLTKQKRKHSRELCFQWIFHCKIHNWQIWPSSSVQYETMLLILLEDIFPWEMILDFWVWWLLHPPKPISQTAKMKLWNARLSKLTFAIHLVNFPSASVAFLMKTKWAATRHKWQQPLIYRMQKVPTPLASSTFNEKGSPSFAITEEQIDNRLITSMLLATHPLIWDC